MKRRSAVPALVLVSTAGVALALGGCQQAPPARTAEAAEGALPLASEAQPHEGVVPGEAPSASVPETPPPAPPEASVPPAPPPVAAPAPVAAPPAEPLRSAPPPVEAPPALTSKPAPEPRVLPAGTTLPLVLQTTVASNTSQVGDRVVATLGEDVSVDGRVILAAGTEVAGRVTAAKQSGRVKGRARLAMEFDEVRDGGSLYRIRASAVDITADSSRSKDAKIAGGAAAAGAIIGAIAGGGKGALKGGAIGGAAGGAAVLATRGKEVALEAGSAVEVTVSEKTQID